MEKGLGQAELWQLCSSVLFCFSYRAKDKI